MKTIFRDKNDELRIIWSVLYAILSLFLPLILTMIISTLLFKGNDRAFQYLNGVISGPAVIFMAWFYFNKISKTKNEFFDFNHLFSIKKLLAGIMIGLALVGISELILVLLGQMNIEYHGISLVAIGSGIFTFTAMALIEEIAYRGIVESAFAKYGAKISIIASALFFTFTHSDLLNEFHVMRMIELIVMGICFSVAMRVTKSLVFASAFHLTCNVLMAVVFGRDGINGIFHTTPAVGSISILTGETTGASLIMIGTIVVITILLALYGKRKKTLGA